MHNLSRKEYWDFIIIYLLFIFGIKFLIGELLESFPDFTIWLTNLIIVPFAFFSFIYITAIIYLRVQDFSDNKILFALFFVPTAITYIPDLIASFKISFTSSIYGDLPVIIRYLDYQFQAMEKGFLGIDYGPIAIVSLILLVILGIIPTKKKVQE